MTFDKLVVRVRYSRGAEFSGTCYYTRARVFVNLGRHNVYPYLLGTQVARCQRNRTHWWRELYRLIIADAYQLALFVFLHEFYHYLIKQAGRSRQRREALCDRFATRALVDYYGARLVDSRGRPVARDRWDFRDLESLVAAAPQTGVQGLFFAATGARKIPVTVYGSHRTRGTTATS